MPLPDSGAGWMGPLPASSGCDCHICRPEDSYEQRDRKTINTVLEHGWQVMIVSGNAPCSDPEHHEHSEHDHGEPGPEFAYTVGLGHRCGHPELLMSGLDRGLMHRALNGIARRVMNGLRLTPGAAIEDVLSGAPVVAMQVEDDALRETVTWSGWFHRRKPEAFAIVWPSTSGVFAWQPGAPAALDKLQPPQWRVPVQLTDGVAVDPQWPFPVPSDHRVFSCVHVVEEGAAILFVAREPEHFRGEDWTVHCGEGHDVDGMRLVHFAHLVRSAPSLRALSDLALNEYAERATPDSAWSRARVNGWT